MDFTTIIIIFIVFDFLLIGFVYVILKKQGQRKALILQTQTRKRNGKIVFQYGLFPKLVLDSQGVPVSITISRGDRKSPPRTAVSFYVKGDQKLQMHVSPEFLLSSWVKKMGMKDLQLMNPVFDDAFIIQTNNEMLARQVLSHEIQEIMLNLKDLKPLLYNYNYNYIVFSVGRAAEDEAQLSSFLDSAERVVQHILSLKL